MKKAAVMAILVISLMAMLLTGCSGSSVVGKWSADGQTIEFKDNGTCVMVGLDLGEMVQWKQSGNDIVIFVRNPLTNEETEAARMENVSVSGNTMQADLDGVRTTLTRS